MEIVVTGGFCACDPFLLDDDFFLFTMFCEQRDAQIQGLV